MKIATFNTNSIRARSPIIIDWLKQEQPDILCVQETKVQDRDFPADKFNEIGYRAAFHGQKSYNGVAIITRLPYDNVRSGLYGDPDEEARFISADIMGIPVVNVYVPQGFAPGTDKFTYKLRWMEDLLSYLSNNHEPKAPLVIAGDFNCALESIDLYDPDQYEGHAGYHPDERALMRKILAWGLADIFRKYNTEAHQYTFWDYRIPNAMKRKKGWRIDYILVTAPLVGKSKGAWIDTRPRALEKPSDHTFLTAEFEI
jgi:exodeoxyribonuclease-3